MDENGGPACEDQSCARGGVGPHVSHTGTERAGYHRFFGRGTYGLHCKGVTASGVPLPELTQPAAVSLNGLWSSYGSPPSVTISPTS